MLDQRIQLVRKPITRLKLIHSLLHSREKGDKERHVLDTLLSRNEQHVAPLFCQWIYPVPATQLN